MSINRAFIVRASALLLTSVLAVGAWAQPNSLTAKPVANKESSVPTSPTPAFKFVADKAKKQTCSKEGTSVAGGTRWCCSGEMHECNGKTGEWVNLRTKCKS